MRLARTEREQALMQGASQVPEAGLQRPALLRRQLLLLLLLLVLQRLLQLQHLCGQ